MKFIRFIINSISVISITIYTESTLIASDLTDILPLTDQVIMLRFDDGYIKHYGYHQTGEACITYNYPLNTDQADDPQSYLISSPDDPFYYIALSPADVGRKSKGHDFSSKCL